MQIHNFKLFSDIARMKSISRGAALNHITQSAASQHVQALEQQLGVKLLARDSRPLTLTRAGALYLAMCRDVLERHEEFQAAVKRLKATQEGTVRVASIYSVGLSDMSQLEAEFARRYPQWHLEVEYLRPEKVYEAVVDGRADLGLVSYAEPSKEVTTLPWRLEQMVVAASPYHPLARKSEVQPVDLEGLSFIAFDEELPIRRDIDRFLREHHVHVNITLHFDNLQMIKEAVAHGSGVSIMPQRIMGEEIARGRLVPIPIAGLELYRPVGIVHRRKKRLPPAGQAFLELLREPPGGRMAPTGESRP